MIVIGENLEQLMKQYQMVYHEDDLRKGECDTSCYDETCIRLSLGTSAIRLCPDGVNSILTYGEEIPKSCIYQYKLGDEGLLIEPKTAVLAASAESIYMPRGYMGLLQTKGSLARLCVSIHFSDGQIDSGFRGPVTFEIFNASDFKIRIRKFQAIGNLYVFKATTKKHKLYSGQYADAKGPTIQKAFR